MFHSRFSSLQDHAVSRGQRMDQETLIANVDTWMKNLNGRLPGDIEVCARPETEQFAVRRLGFFTDTITDLVHFVRKVVQPAVGHDAIHHSYDMYEAINLLANSKLSVYEQIIVLLGGLCHDLGRGAEEKVFGKPMASAVHVWFSMFMTYDIGNMIQDEGVSWEPEEKEIFGAMWRRVQGCVGAHFGANATEDPLRWWVQSGDRLAGIFGIRNFGRNLACDMQIRGARFWPDPKLSCAWGMAPFNNLPPEKFEDATRIQDSWTNVIHYVEVPLRTAYSLVNEMAEARATELKVQGARLLLSLSGDTNLIAPIERKEVTLCHEIFAPEVIIYQKRDPGLFGPHTAPVNPARWDKDNKVLPASLWAKIWEDVAPDTLKQEMKWRDWAGKRSVPVRRLMREFLKRNAYTLDEKEREQLISRVCEQSIALDRISNLEMGFPYALVESARQAEIERARLDEIRKDPNPLLAAVAEGIRDEPIFHQSKDPPSAED